MLRHFSHARGIGLEMDLRRYDVSAWLIQQIGRQFDLGERVSLEQTNLLDTSLAPHSVDVVFMDTDHRYPQDYEYITYLLDSHILRPDFLFIGDDPYHTGTQEARRRLESEPCHRLDIETRPDWNLWWFRSVRSRAPRTRSKLKV